MIVHCVTNRGSALPGPYLAPSLGLTPRTKFNLTPRKDYVVYGIDEVNERTYYFICDDQYLYYPMRIPAPLFQVTNIAPSHCWITKNQANGLRATGFREWATDASFFERLVDGGTEERAIFERYKKLIDKENNFTG
jgi:hypothetical protein